MISPGDGVEPPMSSFDGIDQNAPDTRPFSDPMSELEEINREVEQALRDAESSLAQFGALMGGATNVAAHRERYDEIFETLAALTELQPSQHANDMPGEESGGDLPFHDDLVKSIDALIESIGRAENLDNHFNEASPSL